MQPIQNDRSCNVAFWCRVVPFAWLLTGCSGAQSALAPAGRGAEQIADIFWWMASGAAVIWIAVVGLGMYAVSRPKTYDHRRSAILVIGGGVIVPTVVLVVLLAYGLARLPSLVAPRQEDSLSIHVTGEQWWWRVRYRTDDGEMVELANEIRLPVGQLAEFSLDSPDVIHSFWVPSLGGKMDMIPGRVTRLGLEPIKLGVYRGTCAEYCGASHALMSFYVEVMEDADFATWLERQAQPARQPTDSVTELGQSLFIRNGCGACHSVRGTAADGIVGPDLTHIGSRLSLGAGILPNTAESLARWISSTESIKPDVHMPSFGMLPDDEIRAIAAYLESLQ